MPEEPLLLVAALERTGSTLLTSALKQTGVAGVPREYLNVRRRFVAETMERHGLPRLRVAARPLGPISRVSGRYLWSVRTFQPGTWEGYLDLMAATTNTPNGVFSLKSHWRHYRRNLLEQGMDAHRWERPVRVLRITRRDRLRQAVSLVRAEQTGQWTSSQQARRTARYSGRSIRRALRTIESHDAAWARHFAELDVVPLELAYEDLVDDLPGCVERALGLVGERLRTPPRPSTGRQSGDEAVDWVERFLMEHPEFANHRSVRPASIPLVAPPGSTTPTRARGG